MHLTNYSINKQNDAFEQTDSDLNSAETGHKRSLTFALKYMQEKGHDVEKLMLEVKSMIIKTLIAVQPMLQHTYRSCQPDDMENSMCFEILGFDVMLDDKLRPYIIEINHDPSFETDSPLDFKVKRKLISDTLRLLNLNYYRRIKYKRQK